jgi:hypothetical protein
MCVRAAIMIIIIVVDVNNHLTIFVVVVNKHYHYFIMYVAKHGYIHIFRYIRCAS